MPQRPPASPEETADLSRASSAGDELPAAWSCFGAPPRTLASTVWQVLPQLAVACVVVLASCVGDVAP